MLIPIVCLALLLGAIVGAVILRAAIDMHNRVAGEHRSVIEPKASDAFAIALVLNIMIQATAYLGGRLTSRAAEEASWDEFTQAIVGVLFVLPAVPLVAAGVLQLMLKTSFGRALSVTGIYFLTNALVGIFVGGIVILSQMLWSGR